MVSHVVQDLHDDSDDEILSNREQMFRYRIRDHDFLLFTELSGQELASKEPAHSHLSNVTYWSSKELFDLVMRYVPEKHKDVAPKDLPDDQKLLFWVQRQDQERPFYLHHYLPNGVYASGHQKRFYFASEFEDRLYYGYENLTAVASKVTERAVVCPSMIFKKNLKTGILEDTGHRLWRIWYTRCNNPEVWGLIYVSQTGSFQLAKDILSSLKEEITINFIPYNTDPIFR